jgi:plasmid stabilization system protein ParE
MRVVWTETAANAVSAAYDYLFEINPRAAQHLAQSLFATADSLVNFPHRGRLVPKTDMRELVSVHPYIIRYRIDGDTVVILRVRHSSRRPTAP